MIHLFRRLMWGETHSHQSDEWRHHFGRTSFQQIMDRSVTDRFHTKQGRSTGRIFHRMPDGSCLRFYLKRHFSPGLRHRFFSLLGPAQCCTPAWVEHRHLLQARELQIPVPNILATSEKLGPGLAVQSFLAIEELTDMLPLHEAIPLAKNRLSETAFRKWKGLLIQELSWLSRTMHEKRLYHKDLYLCHFYLHEKLTSYVPIDFRTQVHMIDFHRLSYHVLLGWYYRIKDLAQLAYSTTGVDGIESKDIVRFMQAYAKVKPLGNSWKRLWQAVRVKTMRYQTSNLRKKLLVQGKLPSISKAA